MQKVISVKKDGDTTVRVKFDMTPGSDTEQTYVFKYDSKRLNDKKPILIGIRCRWFTNSGEL